MQNTPGLLRRCLGDANRQRRGPNSNRMGMVPPRDGWHKPIAVEDADGKPQASELFGPLEGRTEIGCPVAGSLKVSNQLCVAAHVGLLSLGPRGWIRRDAPAFVILRIQPFPRSESGDSARVGRNTLMPL